MRKGFVACLTDAWFVCTLVFSGNLSFCDGAGGTLLGPATWLVLDPQRLGQPPQHVDVPLDGDEFGTVEASRLCGDARDELGTHNLNVLN